MTVSDALRHGFLDRSRKTFCNAHSGEVYTLDEAIRRGWIQTKSNYDRSRATTTGFSWRGKTAPRTTAAPVGPAGM